MSRDRNCGPAAKKEAGVSYKSPRTFENKLCTCNLQQNDEFQISTYPSRQPNCLELPLKDGREKESGTFKSFKGDSELTSQTSDHDYYGVPSRLPESSEFQDFTELKLFPQVFQRICQKVGQSEIDLFASRLSNQLPAYYSWKPDPNSLALDALQETWYHKHLYNFSPFSLIHRVLKKVGLGKVSSLTLIAPI